MKRCIALAALFVLSFSVTLHAQAAKKRLTVELVASRNALVSPGISAVRWRPDGEAVTYVKSGGSGSPAAKQLWIFDVGTKAARLLLTASGENQQLGLESYEWAPQGNSLLLTGDHDLWLVNPSNGDRRRLTHDSAEEEFPTFSPGGDRIAFVKQNSIYTLDLSNGAEKQLTADGSENVLNGKLDWVYEEELAYRAPGRAFAWSPDGSKIAYLRLDDSPVPQYPLTDYLKVHAALTLERFPQAGDTNPLPSFHVVALDGGQQWTWNPGRDDSHVEYIAPLFNWTPDSKAISFLTLNRHQTELTVHLWQAGSSADPPLLVERDRYWINSLAPPLFISGGKRFLWLSERDGWLHLYLYMGNGHLTKQLTSGQWEISLPSFGKVPSLSVDEKTGWVYFEGNRSDPREQQIYRVRLEGGELDAVTRDPGSHSLNLSPGGRYLVDAFSTYEQPPEERLLAADGTFLATLDKPRNRLDEFDHAKPEWLTIKARDGATLYSRLTKPPDFDPRKKYPVIVYVYGGPHAQMVKNEWTHSSLLDDLFAQEGFLVWTLDNRGSFGRGHAFESVIFKHMGRKELEDQLDGVKYLKSLPYVDGDRLGIRGWSYGGYMTLYALTHAPGVFRCGAAGGSVTDWKFYDSIYTERYMRTPQENPEGYQDSSPLVAAAKLQGSVLLIHGADDDNVHMQNTMNFVNALVAAGHSFELYIQPGQKHGFQGDTVNTYLDQRLLDFFRKNLQP